MGFQFAGCRLRVSAYHEQGNESPKETISVAVSNMGLVFVRAVRQNPLRIMLVIVRVRFGAVRKNPLRIIYSTVALFQKFPYGKRLSFGYVDGRSFRCWVGAEALGLDSVFCLV